MTIATERERPECELIGRDGNIFAIVGSAAACLKRAGMKSEAEEMASRVLGSKSYDEALSIITEYIKPI